MFNEKELLNLREEMLNKNFNIAYQPIVSTKEGKVKSLESLFRLKNAKYNTRIAEVIEFAKDENFLGLITEFMIDNIVEDFDLWRKKNFIDEDFFISLNLSYEQLSNETFDLLLMKINSTEIKTSNIFLEVNGVKKATSENILIMSKLQSKGFKIAIDAIDGDVNEINGLLKVPYNMVKIDKNFIKNVFENESMEKKLVQMIINQNKESNISIVCEGIESNEQAKILNGINSDYQQGFLYSRPVFKSEIISTIKKINSRK